MRFLLDQDVYAATSRFLCSLGHDAVTTPKAGLSRSVDSDLLKAAAMQNRILVTRDRDFGGLVFLRNIGAGVIYLRLLPSTIDAVHQELDRALRGHSEAELMKAFVVIEPGRHRFRRLPGR